uniref:NADH-ubiquinone oxidoreductase chain 4L n=1 Tax=Teredorus bashanensis TaxID=2936563 RepID=A0A8T9VXK5_9ORTH|nr:NADH dehydrogenase subunit 4L [Teredorus bashanensis]YP_010697732.1 NADH dehydrogenase subunit 4L [Teredorus anhuiensis]UPH84313.1 NADH dehydrogenase subunit 4L [Teredorus bashanensis]WCF76530.1 NADH dehydrogenase subunit 4L [Teredorus anhuiensis]
MFLMFFFFLFIFYSGLYVFCSVRKHLLLVLLSLEYMVLSVFFLVFLLLEIYGYLNSFLVIYLIFSVCEGALGLSVLVGMIRSEGNDYVFSSFVFMC